MLFIKIVIPVIISITLQIISSIIYKEHLKSIMANFNNSHVVVKLPSIYITIGISDIVVFLTFFLLCYYLSPETSALWVRILFILFVLLGILVVIAVLRWKIDIYNDDFFDIRGLLKKKRIKYKDIISVKTKERSIIVYFEKSKIHIDPFAVNIEFFLAALKKHKVKFI